MTDTADEIALISDSLECYAERHGDMAPRVYKRFFELNPEAAALMEYSDEYMRGRMFASMLELFLSDEHLEPGGYLTWELENHINHGALCDHSHLVSRQSLFQRQRDSMLELLTLASLWWRLAT